MKTLIWLISLFALGVPAWATTTLRLHLSSAGTTGYQEMSLAQGGTGNENIARAKSLQLHSQLAAHLRKQSECSCTE